MRPIFFIPAIVAAIALGLGIASLVMSVRALTCG